MSIQKEIKKGLKEVSEGKVVPLDLVELRQEIREGIQQIGHNWFCPGGLASRTIPYNDRTFEGDVVKFLDAKGVVIKVYGQEESLID